MLVPYRRWDEIVEHFGSLKRSNVLFEPMAELVTRIAGSEYSKGLFAITSMQTLVIGQTPELNWAPAHEVLTIRYKVSGEFEFQYLESNTKKNWERKTKEDPFKVFERFLQLKNWFVRYDEPHS